MAARVVETSIGSFGQSFTAFIGYLKEREITVLVIAAEEQETARVRAWSDAVIAQAEARTEEVRYRASLVLAEIEDRPDAVRREREHRRDAVKRESEESRDIVREMNRRLAQKAYERRGEWPDMLSGCLGEVGDLRKRSRDLWGQFREIVRANLLLIKTSPMTFEQQEASRDCVSRLEEGMARLQTYSGPYLQRFIDSLR